MVGGDAELPCHLSVNMSAEQVELRWFRHTFSPAVLVYQAGRDLEDEQMPEYRGRATLVPEELAEGIAALRIRGVRASDDGEYRCVFREDSSYQEAAVRLSVTGECTEGFDLLWSLPCSVSLCYSYLGNHQMEGLAGLD